MSIKKKIVAGLGTAGVVAGLLIGGAGTAQAAIANCDSGEFCLAPGNDFTGTGYGNVNSVSTVPSYINNKSNSAYNHGTQCSINAWDGTGYSGGTPLYMAKGAAYGNLGTRGFANKISSFKFC